MAKNVVPGKLYKVLPSFHSPNNDNTVCGYRAGLRTTGPALARIPVGDIVLAVRFPTEEDHSPVYNDKPRDQQLKDWVVVLHKEQLWLVSVRFLKRVFKAV